MDTLARILTEDHGAADRSAAPFLLRACASSALTGARITLDRARAEAWFGGVRIDIEGDTYQLLAALLDSPDALLDRASFGAGRSDARLDATVAHLNDALARCAPRAVHVARLPGKGYQLRAPVLATRMVGRSAELARVAELLQEHRFVTIAGPGGIGKTTLARAVAALCAQLYLDGIRFIDLAVLAHGRDLAGALGAALEIAHLAHDMAQLAARLRGRRMLIVFDCCEHHASAAAEICERLLRAAPGIDVLCTSREPLLGRSERIVRLDPIGVPDADAVLDAPTALAYPAVEAFVARINLDSQASFEPDARNLALAIRICRAVDGVPLALELAAALVRPLGLEQVARQTSRCLLGWSPLPPVAAQAEQRHRTLAAMLDWSYESLAPHEQRVLRCLAVFRGNFSLEAAAAVAADSGLDADGVSDTVIELMAKSLVSMHTENGIYTPRLLDLTREYAHDKLISSGESDTVRGRHARWLGMLMERLERDWMILARSDWLGLYGPWVDDILAAIDWALGAGGEPLLGAQLACVGFSLGDQIGVARAFQDSVRRAVQALGQAADPPPPVISILLRLNAVNADGRDLSAHSFRTLMTEAERNLDLAGKTGSPMLLSSPLTAMWGWPYVRGDFPASLAAAQQIATAANVHADCYIELIGQRTMAQSLHYLGMHAQARQCALQALSRSELRIPLPYQPSPVQVGTSMRIILARVLWMSGAPDQALAMSEEALTASRSDRPVALCQALSLAAVPVAIWRGETGRAARLLVQLRACAEGHGLGFWIDWAGRFEDALAVMDGTATIASRASFADPTDFSAQCRDHLVTFSPTLLMADASQRCATGAVGWCAPELLRAQALRLLASDAEDAKGAAALLLQRALEMAGKQNALGWSLRSATSLAALLQVQGRHAKARAILEPVLERCQEGRATADVAAGFASCAISSGQASA